jgi:hypothetical protein
MLLYVVNNFAKSRSSRRENAQLIHIPSGDSVSMCKDEFNIPSCFLVTSSAKMKIVRFIDLEIRGVDGVNHQCHTRSHSTYR